MNPERAGYLYLKVISPAALLLEAEVSEVQVPGLDGYLGIWPGHRPLNAGLAEGEIIYRLASGQAGTLKIEGGLVTVENDKIIVLTGMNHDD
jgi:F-type H+-transporting ATPase subunit epsilon